MNWPVWLIVVVFIIFLGWIGWSWFADAPRDHESDLGPMLGPIRPGPRELLGMATCDCPEDERRNEHVMSIYRHLIDVPVHYQLDCDQAHVVRERIMSWILSGDTSSTRFTTGAGRRVEIRHKDVQMIELAWPGSEFNYSGVR